MKDIYKFRIRQATLFLDKLVPYLLLLIIIAFGSAIIGFQKDNQKILLNQQVSLDKQDQTLDAIKQLALDNKLTSKQLGDTIICMLQVPISERTPELKDNCVKKATQTTQSQEQAQTQTQQSQAIQSNPQTPAPQSQSEQKNAFQKTMDFIQKGLDRVVGRGIM